MEIGSEFWDAPLTEKQNNPCSGNAYNTLSGRTALEVIARDLKAERGAKSVYMPAYCCDSMIAPFEKNGYEVKLYAVEPYRNSIHRQIFTDHGCNAILLLDYFGFGSEETEVFAMAERLRGTAVILDRVQSAFSAAKACTYADYTVTSWRKWFFSCAATAEKKCGEWLVPKPNRVNEEYSVLDVCPVGSIIVIESTISPGTVEKYVYPAAKAKGKAPGVDVHFAHAPERIIPGNMIYELEHNSRTIGAESKEIAERVKTIYASFCKGEIVLTDIKTAEMTKVVENTFRDINIAFANELAKICREGGMDVYEIIRIANKHPRVNILNPGPGVGGHCISVDPWFLVGDFPEQSKLIHQARIINDSMPVFVLERAQSIMKELGIDDMTRVGLYGLTYKEDVDDVRESPTLQLLEYMRENNMPAMPVYDPMVQKNVVDNQYHDFDKFFENVDMVIVMVGHSQLKNNLELFGDKPVLDTRNVFKDKAYKL